MFRLRVLSTILVLITIVLAGCGPNDKESYSGTVRGRYWANMDDSSKQDGVLVTVEGTTCLVNLSLEEAIRLNVIKATPALSGMHCEGEGVTFNYTYVEIVKGGYIAARKEDDKIVRWLVEPKDSPDSTLVLSADRKGIKSLALNSARAISTSDPKPTFIAAAAEMGPFEDVPAGLSKEHTPKSQTIRVSSKVD